MTDTTPAPVDPRRADFTRSAEYRIANLLKDTGKSAAKSVREIAEFTAERALALTMAAGEPGYEMILRAEADNVLLFAGLQAVEQADEADQRLFSVVRDVIKAGVLALA